MPATSTTGTHRRTTPVPSRDPIISKVPTAPSSSPGSSRMSKYGLPWKDR
ncbi:hypothetical protein [uncultured Nocardioides sp.]|nr:hypothetical protein [uncultured Nocardioides sp.]